MKYIKKKISDKEIRKFQTRYKNLINELDKRELISSATTNVETIKSRFKLAEDYIFTVDK